MGDSIRGTSGEGAKDEPDPSRGTNSSVEALVAAFRKVAGRQKTQEFAEEEAVPTPSKRPLSESSRSVADIVKETMEAFRKMSGRMEKRSAEERSEEEKRGEASKAQAARHRPEDGAGRSSQRGRSDLAEASVEEAPSERPAAKSEGEDGGKTQDESGAAEDLAPAFREALAERGPSSGTNAGVDVSEGALSLPASFLWVTDQPDDAADAVSVEHLAEPVALGAEAFLLRGGGTRPFQLLQRIRSHPDLAVSLKPVFWRRAEGEQSPVADHVDGTWTPQMDQEALTSLRERAAVINRRLGDLIEVGGGDRTQIELRVLQFLATRPERIAPRRTVENEDGFLYPKLSPLLDRGEQEDDRSREEALVQILSGLEERGLLSGEIVMRQHACRNCGCAFLNFEEMCPHCGTSSVDVDDLVHHFRCGFTGPVSEFEAEEGRQVCPRCERQLKQIGTDYEKPGISYACRQCHEEFEDPKVQTTCYRCAHTNSPEEQVVRSLKTYEVTALGEETALYGLSESLLSTLERKSRVLDEDPFGLVAEAEAARIERYQRSTSTFLLVRVEGVKKLRKELGEGSQEGIEKIATAFDTLIHASDYLSARDESLYLFLLTETDPEGARRVGERLREEIEGRISPDVAHFLELNTAVHPLRTDVDLDALVEQFLTTEAREPAMVNGQRS